MEDLPTSPNFTNKQALEILHEHGYEMFDNPGEPRHVLGDLIRRGKISFGDSNPENVRPPIDTVESARERLGIADVAHLSAGWAACRGYSSEQEHLRDHTVDPQP